jgi:predicted MFS family arabinose efflux permease
MCQASGSGFQVDTASASAEGLDCPRSAWAVFESRPFTRIWVATMLGLVGIAMSDAASAWLMTSLNADPRAVSLVQVAAFLPMFMFTLPAGVLVDIVEPRRFLLALEAFITLLIAGFAALVTLKMATPAALLALTFLLSAAWSTAAPAWAALTPLVVPRQDLEAAAAANSVGFNVSRVIGPALGGRLIAAIGIAAPFWGFAVVNAASVVALLAWRPPPRPARHLPAERLWSALRVGLRHSVYNPHLRATLVRTVAAFPFAAAFIALLPLVALRQMTSGPQVYGLLLATASIGAALGSLARPYVKHWLGPDRFVAVGTVALAAAMALLGACRSAPFAFLGAFIAGAGWTTVLASLSVSAQIALPDWVRGRGLAVFLTAVFGSISAGSIVWGYAAAHLGLPAAHFLAAAGAIATIPLSWSWRLQTAEGIDLSPSMHWQAPILAREVEDDSGPVLVTIRYRLAGDDPDAFLDVIEEVGRQRRRDGAYAWGVFADVAHAGVYLETFLIGSWLEARYLRERVTNADREREEQVKALLAEPPAVTLMLHADSPKTGAESEPNLSYYFTTSGTPA